MAAKIISGTETAAIIREELKGEVKILKEQHGLVPGLVTIIVGVNAASVSYVTAKQKTAKELWLVAKDIQLVAQVKDAGS